MVYVKVVHGDVLMNLIVLMNVLSVISSQIKTIQEILMDK